MVSLGDLELLILLPLCVITRTCHHVCLKTLEIKLTEVLSTLNALPDSPPSCMQFFFKFKSLKWMSSHTAMVLTKQAEIANTILSGTYERLY